ncbi:hypothetical protein MtrunA17_Chr6g0481741 [Medicago truncatula]|uniref:Transmembrane protein, putative n=1 Tax=Medicago truncatula TaxID=3880 RepID=G7KKB0_MEDTR|nr:transmembrane protein, putative [Medicago truncatula]RHN52548.1 hypothetical protein MtrunA17_Chr6g0481741 [Medicago truncatula]
MVGMNRSRQIITYTLDFHPYSLLTFTIILPSVFFFSSAFHHWIQRRNRPPPYRCHPLPPPNPVVNRTQGHGNAPNLQSQVHDGSLFVSLIMTTRLSPVYQRMSLIEN